MILTQPNITWCKSPDSTITNFYRKNNTPKMKLTTPQKLKTQGGLKAPLFKYYSLANQLQYKIQMDSSQSIRKHTNHL